MVMAEEPNKTDISDAPACRTAASTLLTGLLCLLSLTSAALPQAAGGSNAFSYSSDLSMPLWGAGPLLAQTLSANLMPEHQVKLHHFDQVPCGSCHEAPFASGDNTLTETNGWKTNVDVNHSCTSFGCHEYDKELNHPIDVPVSPIISGASSNQAATLTCLSCHRPAESGEALAQDTEGDLVLQSAQTLACESCHERLSGSLRRQSHWKAARQAHLVSLLPGRADRAAIEEMTLSGIDSESTACLSCHDEVNVTIPALNETSAQKALRYRSMTDHPIGMDYQRIQSQNPMYYNPLDGRDEIRMFDGKVGCGSCHSPFSAAPSNLVAPYKGSVLCRTCHIR